MSDSEHSDYSSEDDEDYLPDEHASEEDSEDEDSKTAANSTRVKIQTHDLFDAGAMFYQLSYEASQLGASQFCWAHVFPLRDLKPPEFFRKKGGIRLDDDGDKDDDSDSETNKRKKELEEEERMMKQQREEAAKKAKEQELWASFQKDTAFKPSSKPTSSKTVPSSSESKISITRTYDFAGEAIKVTKTVDLESKEAKSARTVEDVKKSEASPVVKPVGLSGIKRIGGLSSVLGQISKKPKMSTLEKSKLDWDTFKDQEGIQDELRNFNKDGYLEKQAFLQRTDERQFDIERDVRKGTRRK
ncbi:craniofacial development protein 1-like isoform X1 [Montipora capricornis]|uniref:craniofacial development protein 1-like isoform X1 n=1 Tax=Montipora capricornis TaxID=246305 RepID=UPI0035F1F4E3